MKSKSRKNVIVRPTTPADFDGIREISRVVYHGTDPWGVDQLQSHLDVFPEGQIVAIDPTSNRVLGMAASLIVWWDDYDFDENWRDFTAHGYFTNHDPEHGRTLYGAEVMVHPDSQGMGVGKAIYQARRDICRALGLRRIRAGARLRGYGKYADQMTPEQYVIEVVHKRLGDPTLSFQIKQGFRVIKVVRNYLSHDPESRGHAAVIEWLNHRVAQRQDYKARDPKFARKRKPRTPTPPTS